jgi:hypothetical protein
LSRTKLLGTTNTDKENFVMNQTANSSVGSLAISMLIADSGTMLHFVTIDAPIMNKKMTATPLAITTANGKLICSTHTALNISY